MALVRAADAPLWVGVHDDTVQEFPDSAQLLALVLTLPPQTPPLRFPMGAARIVYRLDECALKRLRRTPAAVGEPLLEAAQADTCCL
ncbi:MAG TPA: hypothetical protein VGS80_20790, partial [Ktedonobacterales bacterium]|nr:hypothetical protein [Ktedonobacterales bacterium]